MFRDIFLERINMNQRKLLNMKFARHKVARINCEIINLTGDL